MRDRPAELAEIKTARKMRTGLSASYYNSCLPMRPLEVLGSGGAKVALRRAVRRET
jgi:hypothetical protein